MSEEQICYYCAGRGEVQYLTSTDPTSAEYADGVCPCCRGKGLIFPADRVKFIKSQDAYALAVQCAEKYFGPEKKK